MAIIESSEASFPQHLADLSDATHRLFGERYEVYIDPRTDERSILDLPSLYGQLCDDLAGRQGARSGSPRSLPPVWVDAMRWKLEIDQTAAAWSQTYPSPAGSLDTAAGYLANLDRHPFSPADHAFLAHAAATVARWAAGVEALLSDRAVHGLRNTACPECAAKYVRRRDSEGNWSRIEALQVSVDGAHCLNCRHRWASTTFARLGALLGCTPLEEADIA
ncbi:hypothetical protein SEA_MORGANA_139 [Gordonia phage Morgana]|uniref:Uncharacterized protein n=1 Tax=Gordonia phage Morgana TaxID=3137292 RepID=A0AAX4RC94_9CAUD